jgi:hypothetical protein
MSQPFQAWLIQKIQANTALAAILGQDSNGNPAVFPYHSTDGAANENIPFPHVTVAQFGSPSNTDFLDDDPLNSTRWEGSRIAVCVWSKTSVDELYAIYNKVDNLMRGPSANPDSSLFSLYGLKRNMKRDDLFDDTFEAYHLHSEYTAWIRKSAYPT